MSILKRANPDSRQLVPVSGQLEETGETEKKGQRGLEHRTFWLGRDFSDHCTAVINLNHLGKKKTWEKIIALL